MYTTERLAQLAENDMRYEEIALEAKYTIEFLQRTNKVNHSWAMELYRENVMLRASLQMILDNPAEETEDWQDAVEDMKSVAHNALKGRK